MVKSIQNKAFSKTARYLFYKFAMGSFAVFGLATPVSNMSPEEQSKMDAGNLYGDWANVGNDIITSYERYKSEHFGRRN